MESIGANIGEMLAVAMAEGGQTLANAALKYTNMTDACCIAGVKFPKNMSQEAQNLLKWFNVETSKMCEYWDERSEEARYCLFGEILVMLVDGVEAETIRERVERRLGKIRKECESESKKMGERYDDRYRFDEESIYLKENNWGDRRVEEESEEDWDWWTRRAS